MNDHKQQLTDALRMYNQTERALFTADTATQWLGLDGPAYIVGEVRMRALFMDTAGRHWVDAELGLESLIGTGRVDDWHVRKYRDLATDAAGATDLWVFTDTRGRWNATMAPVSELAHIWGYPPPVRLPDGNWARTWTDLPTRTDEQELAWIAQGQESLSNYLAGDQL